MHTIIVTLFWLGLAFYALGVIVARSYDGMAQDVGYVSALWGIAIFLVDGLTSAVYVVLRLLT